MLEVEETEFYFEHYIWDEKHYMFGYEADTYENGFPWIRSLERRFQYIAANPERLGDSAPIFLIREMIKWGSSSKRDISPKFDDYVGQYCLSDKIAEVINSLDHVYEAIVAARSIPGLGPTYASKLLRFLRPSQYGALDDRIKSAMLDDIRERVDIDNGRISNTDDQYVSYIHLLREHQQQLLQQLNVEYTVAEIEMALFQWAADN